MSDENVLLLVIGAVLVLGVGGFAISNCAQSANSAATVVHEEFDAKPLLEKYRYFKRVAAAIEAREADISLIEARTVLTRTTYGTDATKWPRDVREVVAQDQDAEVAMKLSFNKMAAEYNAAMSDKTKAFMNIGEFPKGWPENERVPLRREYAEYKLH